MALFDRIVEQIVQEAVDRGALDDLALAGQPLPPDPFAGAPPEMRMALRVLRNANVVPEEVERRKEAERLREALAACTDPEARRALARKVQEADLRVALLREQRLRRR